MCICRGGSRGGEGAHPARASPKIGKNMIFWHKMVIFHTKYPKDVRGTYKVRNEIETKRNETKRSQRKRNETKRNETKSTKTKQNETKSTKWKRNKTKPTKSTKTKRNTMLDYFPHMSQCLSPGEDRIWSPLNKNTMHLFSGSLSFSHSGFF